MSSFLSNKFLQYRKGIAQPAQAIDTDVYCTSCGYNLRGLTFGRNCPECGEQIRRTPGMNDPLLGGDWSQRQQARLGLALASAALMCLAAARFLIYCWLLFFPSTAPANAYLALALALSTAWTVGVWLVASPRLDARYSKWRMLHIAARWSQLLWLPAYACAFMELSPKIAGTPAADNFLAMGTLLRALAAIGAMGFFSLLMRLTVDAELDDAARRINLCIWMLPFPTVLLAFVPDQVFWVAQLIIGPVVLVWCWYVYVLGRAVLIMQRHVAWSMRLASEGPERMQRVQETRREIDEQVQAGIRPLAPIPGEVPLVPTKRDQKSEIRDQNQTERRA